MNLVYVFLGGGLGAACRWLLSSQLMSNSEFPYGTLAVNLLGCFIIGIASVYLVQQPKLSLFMLVGFLGGFTTFSSFGLDALHMLSSSDYKNFAIYVGMSNMVGILLVLVGHKLGTFLTA
ncbi:MAG: fluoride efflux transporter CrcB [Bacteroidia bacterium]|jgi:CrcB protein|nr:fluoride efflux transporter CrcB [Bacteroidia bacterium]